VIDLPSVSNAPREISPNGTTYRARRLTLSQYAEVLAWLGDRLPANEDGTPILLSAPESRIALATTDGLAVVLHLSLSSCHPELTRDEARALAAVMGEESQAKLLGIAFARRPGFDKGRDDGGAPARYEDLAEVDWGPIWEALSGHQGGFYGAVGEMTLDQMECHLHRGELSGPDTLSMSQVQAMWERDQAGADATDGSEEVDAPILHPGESIVANPHPEATDDGG
jgi:hypothetical protein